MKKNRAKKIAWTFGWVLCSGLSCSQNYAQTSLESKTHLKSLKRFFFFLFTRRKSLESKTHLKSFKRFFFFCSQDEKDFLGAKRRPKSGEYFRSGLNQKNVHIKRWLVVFIRRMLKIWERFCTSIQIFFIQTTLFWQVQLILVLTKDNRVPRIKRSDSTPCQYCGVLFTTRKSQNLRILILRTSSF